MNRSFSGRAVLAILMAAATLALCSCGPYYYKFPQYTFAGRPIPPSQLANRVLVGISSNGTTGKLEILDGNRDLRSNIQNTKTEFDITGYGSGYPLTILNYPEQVAGYVYSSSDNSLTSVDYGKEATNGTAGALINQASMVTLPNDFSLIYSASLTASQLTIVDRIGGKTYLLNIPGIDKVFVNPGGTVALAMLHNANTMYRIIRLNNNQAVPPGAIDCQPLTLPVYCAIPVNGTYDRPNFAYFSLDGSQAYILNCGPECGGTKASVSFLNLNSLLITNIPTSSANPSDPGSLSYNPVITNTPVPGGATMAVSDGTTLYISGQQLQKDGLFEGFLSTITLSNYTLGAATYPISDGNHSKMLFADDNTLWIGSQYCASGERAKLGLNYNCLTRFDTNAKTATIVPNVTPGGSTTVPYPNTDNNQYYYGSLTGLCWVQNMHKVYTAYGGQIHAFNTGDGSEINNLNITVQGTALDVAYMDAVTNIAN